MDIIAWHRFLFGHHFRCYYSVDNNVVAIDMEYDCPAVHHRHCAGFGMDASGDEVTAVREGAGSKGEFRDIGVEPPDISPPRFGTVDFRHVGFDVLHVAVSLGGEDNLAFTHSARSAG